jgi:hypothetical protein
MYKNKFDWSLMDYRNVSFEFIELFKDYVDWGAIMEARKLSSKLLLKFKDYIIWYDIPAQHLPEYVIDSVKDRLNWRALSKVLDEKTLRKYLPYLNWYRVSCNTNISEQFIEEFWHKLDTRFVCRKQKLSEGFIKRHANKVYWYEICGNQILGEPFMCKMQKRLYWGEVSSYQRLSPRFMWRFRNKLNWNRVSACQYFSPEDILRFRKYISTSDMINRGTLVEDQMRAVLKISKLYAAGLASTQYLNEPFIDEFHELFSWGDIARHQRVSIEFMKKHAAAGHFDPNIIMPIYHRYKGAN